MERIAFTPAEVAEIRSLLGDLGDARRADQRIALARLRRMGLGIAQDSKTRPHRENFESLLKSEELRVDEGAAEPVGPHPSGNVFRVAVGVTGNSIPADWNAFDQRYQWFGRPPQSVTSGAHLFVLAVDRWRSAVVGLYEAVSPGAAKLPNSPDPDRWPWALGVRPLAAIPPPLAERVEGQTGPQSGLPMRVYDEGAQELLYGAVAASPPPPGPQSAEQRVQELEWRDLVPDVLEAVRSLGGKARGPEIVARAIELGEWNDEELRARAWYTGGGIDSHIEHILNQALLLEQGAKGRLDQIHGLYLLAEGDAQFGAAYRPAAREEPSEEELPPHVVDLAELDRATKRHMRLQDRLAEALRQRGIEPLSAAASEPRFDLAFESGGNRYVVEVKSGNPPGSQQVRLGVGQVLEYRHLLAQGKPVDVRPVILVETNPSYPWPSLANEIGLRFLVADRLEESLTALLDEEG
jgi:hypothetical protein